MNKEKVYLPTDESITARILNGDTSGLEVDWNWISSEDCYVDLSKGIQDTETVLQRKSDGKLFKFEWSHTNQHRLDDGGLNDWPIEGEEVIAKQQTITIYE